MTHVLHYLTQLAAPLLWVIFLLENMFITASVLVVGRWMMKGRKAIVKNTWRDWLICIITNVLNTVVTYTGFWLWRKGFIVIDERLSWRVLSDFVILFFAMDFLMYVFHFGIHKTFLYKAIHGLHHESVDPKPIDLFVLHPAETLAFGSLWLLLLMCGSFSLIAIVLYLFVNVLFGMIGHLGMEPLPAAWKDSKVFLYIGTSTFHHHHHKDEHVNFGFYTSIWDRLFGTIKK